MLLTAFITYLIALISLHLFHGTTQTDCLSADEALRQPFNTSLVEMTVDCPHTLQCAADDESLRCIQHVWNGCQSPDWGPDEENNPGCPKLVGKQDDSGQRGFDNMAMSLLTMFIHMSGDGGMNEMPDLLGNTTTVNKWFVWSFFALVTLLLTWVCMNLLLAVCLGAFNSANSVLLEEQIKRREEEEGADGAKGGATLPTGDFEDERRRMLLEAAQQEQEGGAVRNIAKAIVSSHLYSDVVSFFVLIYVMLLLTESNDVSAGVDDHLMKDLLFDAVLVCFGIEILVRLLGLGFVLFFNHKENIIDIIIFMTTTIGVLAVQHTADDAEERDSLWKFLRLLRVSQVVRIFYKLPSIYKIMRKVLNNGSWKALGGAFVFLTFSLCMGSILGMHVLGGGLGPMDPADRSSDSANHTTYSPYPNIQYPRSNFETFSKGILACMQVLLGDGWSSIMLWYMNYGSVGIWAAIFFPLLFLWLFGIVFNSFVSILLINFAVEDADKMPEQRRIYWEHNEDWNDESEIVFLETIISRDSSRAVVDDEIESEETKHFMLKNAPDMTQRSFFIFSPQNPIRLQCASIQDGMVLIGAMVIVSLTACYSLISQDATIPERLTMYYDLMDYWIIFLFTIELIVKSIQGGFYLNSGPTSPYLKETWNIVNFVVLCCMASSLFVGSFDPRLDPYIRLINGIGPMFGLLQINSIRDVVAKFTATLPEAGKVMVPVFFTTVIFSCVGVELYGGKMKRCYCLEDPELAPLDYQRCDGTVAILEDTSSSWDGTNKTTGVDIIQITGKKSCLALNNGTLVEYLARGLVDRSGYYVWKNRPGIGGFDDVTHGIIVLFKMMTDGYVQVMDDLMDITEVDQLPEENVSPYNVIFVIVFHMAFTLFLMNLFIGVMSAFFSIQSGKSIKTDRQKGHQQCQEDIEKFEPVLSYADRNMPKVGTPLYAIRILVFRLVNSSCFNGLAYAMIIGNVLILSLLRYPFTYNLSFIDDSDVEDGFKYVNIAMNTWFTLEVLLRMTAFGAINFFDLRWHVFDSVIVAGSWALLFGAAPSGVESLRILRCLKLLAALQRMKSLIELLQVVQTCLEDALEIFTVLLAVFYVYAVVGMKTFGQMDSLNSKEFGDTSFKDFSMSLKSLFQIMCGSGYTDILSSIYFGQLSQGEDEETAAALEHLALVYFLSFNVMAIFIVLNLFIVVVLDSFDEHTRVDERVLEEDDLWGYTYCWAGLSIGAACPSLTTTGADKIQKRIGRVVDLEKENDGLPTVVVENIPDSIYTEEQLRKMFSEYGEVEKVKMKEKTHEINDSNECFVVYKEMTDKKKGFEKLLKPNAIPVKDGKLTIRKSKALYASDHSKNNIRIPGDNPDLIGALVIRVEDATGVPEGIRPAVEVKLMAKHLRHGGHHITNRSISAHRVDGLPDTVGWTDEDDVRPMQFQVNEHTLHFVCTMIDSHDYTAERWSASTAISLDVFQKDDGRLMTRTGVKLPLQLKTPSGNTVILNVSFDYTKGGEGISDWKFLEAYAPDNRNFKNEICQSSGIDGWVWMKKGHAHTWRRTWMCVTMEPRKLLFVQNCSSESQFNELGRIGHNLLHECVSIPATELDNIDSGVQHDKKHGDPRTRDREFHITRIFPDAKHHHQSEDHYGFIRVSNIEGLNLPSTAGDTCHVSVEMGHYNHDTAETKILQLSSCQFSNEASSHIIPVPEQISSLRFVVHAADEQGFDQRIGTAMMEIDVVHLKASEGVHHSEVHDLKVIDSDEEQSDTVPQLKIGLAYATKANAKTYLDKWHAANVKLDKETETSTVYHFRASSGETRDGWCTAITWATAADATHAPRPFNALPVGNLNPKDMYAVMRNPSMIDLPYGKAGALISNLVRFGLMDLKHLFLSKDNMLYMLFALEEYAWKKSKSQHHQHSLSANTDGLPISAFKGLDFDLTLERLSMEKFGVNQSLGYAELVEQTDTEKGLIALRIIQTLIGASVFRRRAQYARYTQGDGKFSVWAGDRMKRAKDKKGKHFRTNPHVAADGKIRADVGRFPQEMWRKHRLDANGDEKMAISPAYERGVEACMAMRIRVLMRLQRIARERSALKIYGGIEEYRAQKRLEDSNEYPSFWQTMGGLVSKFRSKNSKQDDEDDDEDGSSTKKTKVMNPLAQDEATDAPAPEVIKVSVPADEEDPAVD